jgi:hypothetical protein
MDQGIMNFESRIGLHASEKGEGKSSSIRTKRNLKISTQGAEIENS